MTKSRWENGALVFYEGGQNQRVLDAIGGNVQKYITDFVTMPVDDTTGDPTEWTVTMVEAGDGDSTMALESDAQGGWVNLQAAGNEDDGVNAQMKGEPWKMSAGDRIYFTTKFYVDEAKQSDFLLGLCIGGNTTLLGGMTDGAYFRSVDGSAAMTFVTEKDSTETSTAAATVVAATTYILQIVLDGTGTVYGYVNGTCVASHTTNLPDDEALTISLAYLNGAAQASKGLHVDYIRCIAIQN